MTSPGAPDVPQKASSAGSLKLLGTAPKKPPEMYATEAVQGGDASRKDARRVGRRVESWFELSCVE